MSFDDKFSKLNYNEYYIKRNIEKSCEDIYGSSYWETFVDPDGVVRVPFEERDRKINDLKEEIAYINSLPPGRVLDVGCGPGHVLSGISTTWERHGVELSKCAADEAKKYCENIHNDYLENIKFDDKYFDAIISYHVLEHVENPMPLILEMRRIMKDHGILIISVPNFDSGCARYFGEKYRMLHDPTHVTLFSEDSMRRILRDTGFSVERVDFPYFDTLHFTKENLERLLDNSQLSPPFYGNIMTMYARKKPKSEIKDYLKYITDIQNMLCD